MKWVLRALLELKGSKVQVDLMAQLALKVWKERKVRRAMLVKWVQPD